MHASFSSQCSRCSTLLLQRLQCPCMSGLQVCTNSWLLLLRPPQARAGPPARPSVHMRLLTSTAVTHGVRHAGRWRAHPFSSSLWLWHLQLASNTGQLLPPLACPAAAFPSRE